MSDLDKSNDTRWTLQEIKQTEKDLRHLRLELREELATTRASRLTGWLQTIGTLAAAVVAAVAVYVANTQLTQNTDIAKADHVWRSTDAVQNSLDAFVESFQSDDVERQNAFARLHDQLERARAIEEDFPSLATIGVYPALMTQTCATLKDVDIKTIFDDLKAKIPKSKILTAMENCLWK